MMIIPGCSDKKDGRSAGASSLKQPAYAEDMKQIYKLMSSKPTDTPPKPVDFTAIEKVYRANLSSLVRAYGQPLSGEIDSAIERGKRCEQVAVQKQWLDKGLQQAIYHTALQNLDRAQDDTLALKKAEDLIACLGTVMDRRAKWYSDGVPYKDQVSSAFSAMKGAPTENKARSIVTIKAVLNKVYLLSLIWEMRGLAAARGKGGDAPAMKKLEGTIYYNVFALPAVKDTAMRASIADEWQKDPLDINIESIKTGLARAVPELWNELPDSIKAF
ncbi:MAG: hypothetical protein MUF22_02735 [Chitinispirillaceae bacterium]|jgi:hypothetical protein|nr:hypothetical protein [Chitinispirillaceae bacterium]